MRKKDDGMPGAAKNTGDDACLLFEIEMELWERSRILICRPRAGLCFRSSPRRRGPSPLAKILDSRLRGNERVTAKRGALYFSAGATATSLSPLFLSDSATKPEAFISSTKTLR